MYLYKEQGSEQLMNYAVDLESVIRLVISMIMGCTIGLERERKGRAAGIKTFSVVCIGATLVMMTGEFIYNSYPGNMDIARLSAQVISGIGFLGVGTIIISGNSKVRGLSTAASLWVTACLGLAIGIGFYFGAIISYFMVLILFTILRYLDKVVRHSSYITDIYIELADKNGLDVIDKYLRSLPINIIRSSLCKPILKSSVIGMHVSVTLTKYNGGKNNIDELITQLNSLDKVALAQRELT